MKIDTSKFTDLLQQMLLSTDDRFEDDINPDTFIYTLSLLPQFDITFNGDKKVFKSNMEEVVQYYKENEFDKFLNDDTDGLDEYVSVDSGMKVILSDGSDIMKRRGGVKVCIADTLLAMRTSYPDFMDYVCLASGDVDDFINSMYMAEEIDYTVWEYEDTADFEEYIPQGHKSKSSNWTSYCKDLIEESKKETRLLVGREKELSETIRILCRKEKANPLHLGEAGVGKTEITLGLCRKIIADDVPEKIKGAKVFSLDLGALLAGTQYRGEMEDRLVKVIAELEKISEENTVILYIDEIHMICGAGKTEGGSMDVANIIKPLLTKSKIKVIGATTFDEYKSYIEKDKALERRFKTVKVVEPTPDEAKEILKGIAPIYEEFHNVKYEKSALDSIVDLTVKYVHDKRLPDKAIDIMDEVGASISQNNKAGSRRKKVTSSMVESIIAQSYNIPKETIEVDELSKLKVLESKIKESLFGQDEAVKVCVENIKLNRLGLGDDNKPIANLLFVGQTGVGKTELAQQLAKNLDIDFVRFDMSEYSDEMSVTKLIGASAGYVGYEDGGLLVEEIRKHPYCVLLLDEIEKAHPKVFDTLLQVMDNATLTDNKGRKAIFKNVILIMTSNAGASAVVRNGLGFGADSKVIDMENMNKAVTKTFRPEFINRLTEVVRFNSLTDEMADSIVKQRLSSFMEQLKSHNINVKYDDSVIEYIKKKGITKEYGARELLRVINKDIKSLFVEYLLEGKSGQVVLTVKDGNLTLI